jgi:hypothetical protein
VIAAIATAPPTNSSRASSSSSVDETGDTMSSDIVEDDTSVRHG